jgi:hypothetical protein
VVRYIFEVGGERPVQVLRELAASEVGKEAEVAVVSYAEQLRREGERRGRRLGGRQARRKMLLRLLSVRFGDLPEAAIERVKAAKSSQLELWAERLLSASMLGDVFGDS